MKQQIMEKVVSGEELSHDEMIFVARNLQDSENHPLPYDHSKPSTIEACGITKRDVESMNEVFGSKFKDEKVESISQVVEAIETLALTDEKFMRMVAIQCAVSAKDQQSSALEKALMDMLRKKREE